MQTKKYRPMSSSFRKMQLYNYNGPKILLVLNTSLLQVAVTNCSTYRVGISGVSFIFTRLLLLLSLRVHLKTILAALTRKKFWKCLFALLLCVKNQ